MKIAERSLFVSVLAATSFLAACGGGGDSGSEAPIQSAPTLAITTANRDLVSHDAVAGVMSLAATASIPLGSVPSAATTAQSGTALPSSWTGRIAGSMLGLRATLPGARQRALAMTPPFTEPCSVSGSTTTTVDDRDNSGDLSVGDYGTVVFDNCRDTATETVNGTTTILFSRVDQTLGAHVTVSGMSTVTVGHSLTIDGAMLMEIAMSTDAMITTIKTTAEGPVQAKIVTHVPFSDTVTLQPGFVINETIDLSIALPAGAGTTPGRTLTSLSGRMQSVSGNGTFDVVTDADITRYLAEDYPRAGTLRATGASGVLVMRTTSASSVVLDLDWNDDGRIETSEAKTWDWLI